MPSPVPVAEVCACGHPSQDHDPWPDCTASVGGEEAAAVLCTCREWRPVR